jgi:hypothetical protein
MYKEEWLSLYVFEDKSNHKKRRAIMKKFIVMGLMVIGLMFCCQLNTSAQTFTFTQRNSSVYIQAWSGLDYVHYSFYNNDAVPVTRYNSAMANIFLGPCYLNYFQKPPDAFGTFVQEFYFFKGITRTNPLENLESPIYSSPKMYE